MVSYSNADSDRDCTSAQRIVSIGNIGRQDFLEPDDSYQFPATSILNIDVLAPEGDQSDYHFVTLIL